MGMPLLYDSRIVRPKEWRRAPPQARELSRTGMKFSERGVGQAARRAGRLLFLFASLGLLVSALACELERRKSDAELGLNSQQATGRRRSEERRVGKECRSRW